MTGITVRSAPLSARVHAVGHALSALRIELIALIAIAGTLNLWSLSQNGWANVFYSAAVRSMSSSSHDFLYASFDPSGVMTVDKPPLSLWIQTLSVELFGFHPLSILVPSALIGVAAAVLVYDLTRRYFGRAAGFVAGLALATTPVTVAMSRHNNPDILLTLCCAGALWCVARGLERGRTAWIVLAGVCVGLGFETKLAAALVVVPGILAAWFWVAPRGRLVAVGQLLQAGAASVAVALAWPLLVGLTPPGSRPWIGSTSDNSIWTLIGGYNGLNRLEGANTASTIGPFRLLDPTLTGQIGWLLGIALVGGIAIAVASRLRRGDPRTGWIILVGGTFAAAAFVLSTASGIFHPYYTALLAPFTAALVGAAAVELVRSRVAGPLAVAAGAVIEIVVIEAGVHELRWLVPLLVVLGACIALALVALNAPRTRAAIAAAALAGLLVAPAIFAGQTLGHPTSASLPSGGPVAIPSAGSPAPHSRAARAMRVQNHQIATILRYARRHGGGTLAIRSQMAAAPSIIASDARIAGIGGFTGVQSRPTVSWFSGVVESGRVRWVAFGGTPRVSHRRLGGVTTVFAAVAANCSPVHVASLHHRIHVYDCRGAASALAHSSIAHVGRAR